MSTLATGTRLGNDRNVGPQTAAAQISQPPSRTQRLVDAAFRHLCRGFAWLSVLLVVFIILRIAVAALPAVREHGAQFLTGTVWDPNTGQYSILPEIWGTLYSSLLALVVGTAFGVAAALFLSEGYLANSFLESSNSLIFSFIERGPDCRNESRMFCGI